MLPSRLLRGSLTAQLEASLTKADSEQLARSIAEEQYSDLEKEKIMKELEIKDMMARHKQELGDKEATISSVRPRPDRVKSSGAVFVDPHPKCPSFCQLLKLNLVQMTRYFFT